MQAGGSLILSTRLKNGMTTDSTVQPVLNMQRIQNFTVNKSVTADGSLLSQTGGVNTIHPAPEIHEHFTIQTGYGTLCTSSCTISTILRPL